MAFSPRVVLIPLASSSSGGGRVARVQADATAAGRNEAGLNPKLADLADWHLYESGAIALGAVRRLQLPHRPLAVLQRLRPSAVHPYLSVTNGPDLIGLQTENTHSAELGIALAVLMYGAQSGAKQVVATGRLDRQAWSETGRCDDVRILPVGEIDKKIEALRNSLTSQKGAALVSRIHFFLPKKTPDGEDTITRHARELAALVVAFKEAGFVLEVSSVASLRGAASKLGIRFFEVTAADRVRTAGLAAAGFVVVASILATIWLSAPINLGFGVVQAMDGGRLATPLRVHFDPKQGRYTPLDVCAGVQGMPTVKIGDSLVLDVEVTDDYGLPRSLLGHRFVLVAVSEQSGVKVFPAETIKDIREESTSGSVPLVHDAGSPKKLLSIVLPVEGPPEENKIIVLARRLIPFDTVALSEDLSQVVADKPPAARINAVVSHLAGRFPGYLDYSFVSADANLPCEGEG